MREMILQALKSKLLGDVNSHIAREWARGFNVSYFQRLERVKRDEIRRGSEKIHAG